MNKHFVGITSIFICLLGGKHLLGEAEATTPKELEIVTTTDLSDALDDAVTIPKHTKKRKPKTEQTFSAKHRRAEKWLQAVMMGECRGQGEECMTYVGHVIMNRARAHLETRYGGSLYDVIHKRKQFSCLNKNDPNRKVIDRALAGKLKPGSADERMWKVAGKVAHKLMHNPGIDPTEGSTHYMTIAYSKFKPWARDPGMRRVTSAGGHVFYRFER